MAGLRLLGNGGRIHYGVTDVREVALGRVEDVVIDVESGRVRYVVLSLDDAMGEESRLYAVPWQGFRVARDGKSLVLDKARDRIQDAPSFTREDWPDMSDPGFRDELYRFYDEPYRPAPAVHGSTRSAGATGLLAALIVLMMVLGIAFYMLYPRQAEVAAESMEKAAEQAAVVVKEKSEDAATTVRVKTAFGLSKTVSAFDIDVDTDDGVVTLTGEVPSESAKERALAIAEDTSGVSRVIDRLVVSSASAAPVERER